VNELVSPAVFKAVVSILTGGLAGTWFVHDIIFLARLRNSDRKDPLVRDKMFGYSMGILIGVVGVVGTLRFNGVL
jgi:hypothetical protein